MSSRAQQLAEQNVQATTGPSATTTYHKQKGDLTVAPPSQTGERRVTRMSRVARQEWAPSILIFFLDIVIWMALYGMASYLRDHDAAFSGSFQFAVIDIIQLAVIV